MLPVIPVSKRAAARHHFTRRINMLCALGLSAALPPIAFAQTADDVTSVAALNPIVVTASGFEQDIIDAPASISVIPREKLEKGAYRDLTDALRDVPGVIMTPSDNNTSDITLRGMSANYTLILVDGKRMSTRETQTNGSTGTDQSWVPPLEAIERIEVVRGPMSSLYGSDAMGGVINVITRKVPKKWGGSIRLDSTLQQHSASGNNFQGNFYIAGPIKEDLLGFSLYGIYSHRSEDDIEEGYNRHTNRGATARLSLTPTRDHDIVLEAGASKQVYNSTPGKTLLPSEEESEREFKRQHFSLTHDGRWSFGTSNTYVQREETENLSRDMTIRNTTASTKWSMPLFDRHVTTVGAYYSMEDLKDSTTNQMSDRSTVDRWQYAFFAENEWQITDSFALTGGLRLDNEKTSGTHWSPRLYAVWHLNDHWTIKGGVSTGFRAPSLRQTLPDWGASSRGGNMYGNPDLKPEKTLTKEIGLIYNDESGLMAGITLFDNEFTDKITRIPCPECGPVNAQGRSATTYVNVDEAITRGVEATLTAPLSDKLSLTSSYTYTYSKQRSGQYEGNPLNQMPEHMFNLGLDWKPTDKLNTWMKLTYRGKESDPTQGISASSTMAPSATYVDVGGSYDVNKTLTVYAGIYNIFDKQVRYDDYGYVEDGRRYWLGMNVKF